VVGSTATLPVGADPKEEHPVMSMSDLYPEIHRVIGEFKDFELGNRRAGLHQRRDPTDEVACDMHEEVWSRRDDLLGALHGLLRSALDPCIEAGFTAEFVMKRLDRLLTAADKASSWDMSFRGDVDNYFWVKSHFDTLFDRVSKALDRVHEMAFVACAREEASGDPGDRTAGPRLVFDPDTWTVTLEGKDYPFEDPKTFQIYRTIAEVEQPPITNNKIQYRVKGLNHRGAIRDRLRSLPGPLRNTIRTDKSGHWLALPAKKGAR
jgi:hypothetical protein